MGSATGRAVVEVMMQAAVMRVRIGFILRTVVEVW